MVSTQIKIMLSLFIFAPFTFSALVGAAPLDVGVEIKKMRLKLNDVSLYAAAPAGGSAGVEVPLISHNADQALIPASVTKILTAAAALKSLGPTTKFATELVGDGNVEEGVFKADLYLRGGGDPGFVSESMWNLVNDFVRTGITRIDGDIVVDDSLFDKVRFDSARDPVRNDRAYDAPVGAMSMNWNAVNVYVRPGAKVGQPARVFADPDTGYIEIVNQTKTVSGSKADVAVSRKGTALAEEDTVEPGDRLIISGHIGKDAPEKVIYKNISRPELWSGHNLVAFLKWRGISVRGSVRAGKASSSATVLARIESKPLSSMIYDMMKFSNNFVAEMLTKQLALKSSSEPATLARGVDGIRNFLGGLGLKDPGVLIFSPSGFSRKNKISAKSLYQVLVDIKNDFQISPEFATSLPVSGRDGTLKSRMKNLAQSVRAKTGYMTGIVSLAGYVDRGPGDVATFAFLFNGPPDKADEAKALMDHLCERLAKK